MTLRTWAFLFILGVFAIIVSAHAAHADSLWDDMASQPATTVNAKILRIEARGDETIYKINMASGGNDNSEIRLCPQLKTEAAAEVLKEAFRSNLPVTLGLSGPFNPCVVTVHVNKGA